MEASELRIGNYYAIAENDGIKYKQIKYLVESESDFFSNGDNITQAAKPIPLTEEWLLRFGFEKLNRDVPAFENKNLIVEWLFERWTGRLYFDAYTSIQIIETKYVHQLQNLYFALTGEELIIK